ncbi:unnamed protein product [Aphanomyces euteiches]
MSLVGAGSIIEWRDDQDKVVQGYLVYPDSHVGRIMTGIIIVPDCAGFSTPYVRVFADKLSEQGYKVIVPELPTTTATSDEWSHTGMFRKWKDAAKAQEAQTIARVDRCLELLKTTYEIQRVGVLGLGYGTEIALRVAASFDAVVLLSPTLLSMDVPLTTPTLVVTGDRNEYMNSSQIKSFTEWIQPDIPTRVRVCVIAGQRHGFAWSRIADEDAATLAIATILDWPPKRPPVPSESIFEGLSSMKRTFELPQPMNLGDIVELYVDIWDINQ